MLARRREQIFYTANILSLNYPTENRALERHSQGQGILVKRNSQGQTILVDSSEQQTREHAMNFAINRKKRLTPERPSIEILIKKTFFVTYL